LVPDAIARLPKDGIEVVVEAGAGSAAGFADAEYSAVGAAVGVPWDADVVVKVRKPSAVEVESLRSGVVLIAFLEPLTDRPGIDRLVDHGVVAFAMEVIPRIT